MAIILGKKSKILFCKEILLFSTITMVVLLEPRSGFSQSEPTPLALRLQGTGRVDHFGDPLPPFAVARLGTVRLRHPHAIRSLAFFPGGETIAVCSNQCGAGPDTIRFWNVSTGKLVRSLGGLPDGSECLALSRDGRMLAAENQRSSIRIWNLAQGAKALDLPATQGEESIVSLAFSPDGSTLAAAGAKSSVQIWDVARRRLSCRLGQAGKDGWALTYSPNGRFLAWWSKTGVHVWDLSAGKEAWRWSIQEESSVCLAFSPDGQILAAGCEKGLVRLIKADNGKEIRRWRADAKDVYTLAFSPDSNLLASGGKDGAAHIWQVSTGKEVMRCLVHRSCVFAVAFSPDGKTLASGGWDQILRLWDLGAAKK